MIDVTVPLWVYPILIWTIIWKAVGSWKAARRGHLIWFVAFWAFNTAGILPIIYILFFQNMVFSISKDKKKSSKKKVSRKKVKKAPTL